MNERRAGGEPPEGIDERHRALLELLPVAVYTCEAPSGRITFFNAHAAALWGRTPRSGDTDERFCGSFRLWRPDGVPLPHAETPMARALAEGIPFRNGEVVIERPDGSRITVLVNIDPVRDAEGRVIGAVNVFHDTSELKAAAEARARLAAIVESSDDAIVSKDLNGTITSWNAGAERLFGYAAGEAIGRPITILFPPGREAEEPLILERVRRGQRIDHYETVRRRKDGSLVDVSLTVSPIVDERGRVVGASKIARDVSERKQAEAQLAREQEQREAALEAAERARAQAEAANRAKDEFLAMLGHELRNPLSAVRNAVTAAALDDASRPRALAIARRQADQLGRIVDDLLDVARITQGRVRLRKEHLVLGELLQRVVDGARPLMEERGHALTLTLPPEEVRVHADPARLEQAVANLLSNAAKYTDPGGHIRVSAEQRGEEAVVRVVDDGIGIAPDLLPHVFDLFTQGRRSLDRSQGGLGIGLTLVHRIVQMHGGGVEARSAGPGTGSEFAIHLPVSSAVPEGAVRALAERTQRTQRTRRTPRPARVLMVEDNPDAAESLVMILELLGHHVRVVHDGVAALQAASANLPDIMLVDIGLPGMDGYEVARRIRRDPALKHLVLVALTGYGRRDDQAQAMAAGFDYHLVKPVDLDALGDLVGRLAAPARLPGYPDPETRH